MTVRAAPPSVRRERPERGAAPRRSVVWAKMKQERWMYAFIIPGFLFFVVFRYLPLAGNIVAFENYSPYLGVVQSQWVGLENFARIIQDPQVGQALANTVIINGASAHLLFSRPDRLGNVVEQYFVTDD